MKQILKIEISRAFRTKGMLFSLIGGCVLSVLHIIQYQIPAHQTLLQRAFETAPIWTPPNVAGTWIAGNGIEKYLYESEKERLFKGEVYCNLFIRWVCSYRTVIYKCVMLYVSGS